MMMTAVAAELAARFMGLLATDDAAAWKTLGRDLDAACAAAVDAPLVHDPSVALYLMRLGDEAHRAYERCTNRTVGGGIIDHLRAYAPGGRWLTVVGPEGLPAVCDAVCDVTMNAPAADPRRGGGGRWAENWERWMSDDDDSGAESRGEEAAAAAAADRLPLTRAMLERLRMAARRSFGVTAEDADVDGDGIDGADRTTVAGPVYALYDAETGRVQEPYGPCITVVCAVVPSPSTHPVGTGRPSLAETLHHVMRRFQMYFVEFPVLPIPAAAPEHHWRQCLAWLLTVYDYGFRAVFACPAAPPSTAAGPAAESDGEETYGPLPMPAPAYCPRTPLVVLPPGRNPVAVADFLARRHHARTGLLRATTTAAMGCGSIADPADEALIALTTTLPLLDRVRYPALYDDLLRYDTVWLGGW